MRDIEALCSRAVIINSGTLVYDGALSDINHRMGDKRLLTLSFSSPVETGKLSIFGRVRENKDLTAVLEIPKELRLPTYSDPELQGNGVADAFHVSGG